MRQPRIELGAQRWQRWILPLNHWRSLVAEKTKINTYITAMLHSTDFHEWIFVDVIVGCGAEFISKFASIASLIEEEMFDNVITPTQGSFMNLCYLFVCTYIISCLYIIMTMIRFEK